MTRNAKFSFLSKRNRYVLTKEELQKVIIGAPKLNCPKFPFR